MGYTHYWRIRNTIEWLKTWPQLIADAQRIADEAGVPLNHDGDEEDSIELNGSKSSCETFILKPEATGFSFCKTARRPYDLVVTAILLRAWQLAGKAISLSSDGSWSDEWVDAERLLRKLWPDDEKIDNPFEERKLDEE